MRYTFGNTLTAAERLRRIAEFFNPLAANFIGDYVDPGSGSVLDLGCGPGYTTRMLADATKAAKVTGVDQSFFFIEQGRRNFPGIRFMEADVTRMKNDLQYDVIYCRFLLSHLTNLKALITSWIELLYPDGKLVLDELEDVMTETGIFKQYLQISSSLVKSQGAELYVGRYLNAIVNNMKILVNQTHIIPVNDWMAAGWFYGNTIGPWKEEPYILENVPREHAERISRELLKIHNAQENISTITWKMKRIIITN